MDWFQYLYYSHFIFADMHIPITYIYFVVGFKLLLFSLGNYLFYSNKNYWKLRSLSTQPVWKYSLLWTLNIHCIVVSGGRKFASTTIDSVYLKKSSRLSNYTPSSSSTSFKNRTNLETKFMGISSFSIVFCVTIRSLPSIFGHSPFSQA